jgi:hypothetical protein
MFVVDIYCIGLSRIVKGLGYDFQDEIYAFYVRVSTIQKPENRPAFRDFV